MSNVHKRVLKDVADAIRDLPPRGIYVAVEEENYYNVHFVVPGPPNSPFEGGMYHGMIRLNTDHPHKPPNLYMFTQSGRFSTWSLPIGPNDRGICTNFSAFHPEEWTPMRNIDNILTGFLSMFCDFNDHGVGGITNTPESKIKQLAKESINKLIESPYIKKLFPELYNKLTSTSSQNKKSADTIEINTESSEEEPIKKTNKKLIKKISKVSESDDSAEEKPVKKSVKKAAKKTAKKVSRVSKVSEAEEPVKKPIKKPSKKVSVSDSDSSAESDDSIKEEPVKKSNKKTAKKVSKVSDSDDTTESDEEVPIKKPVKKSTNNSNKKR